MWLVRICLSHRIYTRYGVLNLPSVTYVFCFCHDFYAWLFIIVFNFFSVDCFLVLFCCFIYYIITIYALFLATIWIRSDMINIYDQAKLVVKVMLYFGYVCWKSRAFVYLETFDSRTNLRNQTSPITFFVHIRLRTSLNVSGVSASTLKN